MNPTAKLFRPLTKLKPFHTIIAILYIILIATILLLRFHHGDTRLTVNVNMTDCQNIDPNSVLSHTDEYTIHYNYVRAERQFECDESITLTTQSDFRFLGDLTTLVRRWEGPISVAVHAPGSDWSAGLTAISHLRQCGQWAPLIRQFVTFHVFYENSHAHNSTEFYKDWADCSLNRVQTEATYRSVNNLSYPINVARNIARRSAKTYFVFPIDIELIPSVGFIQKFIRMINNSPELLDGKNVFVLPTFEVVADVVVPQNKFELVEMVNDKKAFIFHEKLCLYCHDIPYRQAWLGSEGSLGGNGEMGVASQVMRHGAQINWEPFYVGTNAEPLFDERFTWEGQSNKMIQAFHMCLLNYTYIVLDNAFLIHQPGIKHKKEQFSFELNPMYRAKFTYTRKLKHMARNELQRKIGTNHKCHL